MVNNPDQIMRVAIMAAFDARREPPQTLRHIGQVIYW
jgi:hypothetical protein